MDILITNDDGVRSRGIQILAEWAASLGRVMVVAPAEEQSAKSQSLNIRTRYGYEDVPFIPGIPALAVDSTPADCVQTAANLLSVPFDLVFSGINRGLNIGWDIPYSGTCGAIYEASRLGVPAVAFSCVSDSFSAAYYHLGEVWDFIMENGLLEISPLWNVNFPPEVRGIRLTRQSGPELPRRFDESRGFLRQILSDREAIQNGYVSLTPFAVARTDFDALEMAADTLRK